MKTIKTKASAAKKSARIVTMTAAVAASMNLCADETRAMQCAFEDMADEYGNALIISMDPFDGFCA